jgi:TonB family protein
MSFFVECSLRVSAILIVAFLVALALRKQAAGLRHVVWVAAFGISALTPLLFAWGPSAPVNDIVQTGPVVIDVAFPHSPSAPRPSRAIPWADVALAIWAAGVLVFTLRMVRATITARTLRRAARPLTMFEGVAVGETESAAVALTLGVTSPLILLPAQHRDWEPSRLKSVLMHELAHVRRRDCLVQWLPQIVCALHWFNPLVWLGRAQMLCESERACDDAVLRGGARGPDFARDLLEIAEFSGLKGADPMLVTIATRLERRIARLLDASVNRQPLTRMRAVATTVIVVALLLPLASVRAQNGTQPGSLSGVVSDPTGAVIAKATVNLIGPAGNLALATNAAGVWTAKDLPPGSYQIEVSVPGFAAFRQPNVTLAPGASVQLKEPLAIGQIAETVTVVGAGASPAPAAATAAPRRIRVGGNVQYAKLISKTPPVYPDSERAQGVEGTVRIQAVIGKSGNVLDARVIGGQPSQDFADAALNAVRTWQYEPTRLNGEAVEVITTITVNFQLQ